MRSGLKTSFIETLINLGFGSLQQITKESPFQQFVGTRSFQVLDLIFSNVGTNFHTESESWRNPSASWKPNPYHALGNRTIHPSCSPAEALKRRPEWLAIGRFSPICACVQM